VFVATAQEAIARLRDENWDAALLAHDLEHNLHMGADNVNSGTFIARWLAKNPERIPKIVILHDPYDEGRARMKQSLPDAISFSHAWMSPLGMLVDPPSRDEHSTPLYYPLED
jgi:hypothetical protein